MLLGLLLIAVAAARTDGAPTPAPLGYKEASILVALRHRLPPASPSTPGEDGHSPLLGRLVWMEGGFWIMEHEVTQAQWAAVMGENPSLRGQGCDRAGTPRAGEQLPVVCVTLEEAREFARLVSAREQATYAVPTEAQWRAAAARAPAFAPPEPRAPSAAALAWIDELRTERDAFLELARESGLGALWADAFADGALQHALETWPSDYPALAEVTWIGGKVLLDVAAAERASLRTVEDADASLYRDYAVGTVAPLEVRGRRLLTYTIRFGRRGGFTTPAVAEAEAYFTKRGWTVPPEDAITSYDAEDGPEEVCSRRFLDGALCDLLGNVWEWTASPLAGATQSSSTRTLARGGSWADGPAAATMDGQTVQDADSASDRIGFRLVRAPDGASRVLLQGGAD
jgi:formylglycine-generating enzyme required for sulfatase activity